MFVPAINVRGERILGDSKSCDPKSGRFLGLACLIIRCVSDWRLFLLRRFHMGYYGYGGVHCLLVAGSDQSMIGGSAGSDFQCLYPSVRLN